MNIKLFCITILSAALSTSCYASNKYQYKTIINPENITIARDEYGVPHIFGKTDAEVAYGLAWANAEDAFHLMQESLYSTTGLAGKVKGKEGAAFDFFVHAIDAKNTVEDRFYKDLTPEFIEYIEGYCQGINAFAEAHKDQVVLKKMFPLTPKEIVQVYLVTFSAMVGVADPVQSIMEGTINEKKKEEERAAMGSNAFAMNSLITTDDHTYLCANPHFMVEGPLTFYEAHIKSEQGLNITGSIFQGGTSVFIGNNEHLGWGQTWNYFDGVDVYELKMHPKKKLMYELDSVWHKLEKRRVWLKVRVKKWLTIPVPKTTYWGEHGMVLKSKDGGFYAVRSLAYHNIMAGQQYYYMNKATNFEEFMTALRMEGLSKFNIVYADKDDNIYYVSNGLIPDRKVHYDWSGIVPGNDSKYLWHGAIPVDSLPNNLNPECGFVYNTNNTPFSATCEAHNDDCDRLPSYVDMRPGENNRSLRFQEIVEEKVFFNFEDFKKIKFDDQYPETSPFLTSIQGLFDLDPEKYPHISEPISLVRAWDKTADTSSVSATMYGLAMGYLFRGFMDGPFVSGLDKTEDDFAKSLEYAQDHLMEHFGTLQVPMKEIQRFVKNGRDYTVPGGPDFLMANYPTKPYKNGSFKLEYGDTYIHFVKFSKNGPEQIETLLPFNTLPTADDYVDQTIMYQKRQTKTMSLDKEEILNKAIKIYHPE